MLCFDTLRYDVSKEEEAAGRTPVLNSHGGEWEKRHAPGNFTYPVSFCHLCRISAFSGGTSFATQP